MSPVLVPWLRSLFVRAADLERVFTIVQERNSLGAVKAVTAAQLAMASDTVYRVSLDQAIEAMRLTAADMSVKYKETSLSVRPPWVLALRVVVGPLLLAESSALTGNLLRFPLGFSGKSSGSVFLLVPLQFCYFV